MKVLNTFFDYSVEDNKKMAKIVEEFFPIFEEAATKIKTAKEGKLKTLEDTSRANDIYINPKIKADFLRLQTAELPIHQIIPIYDEWFDELYRLVIVNEPWLNHKPVQNHLLEILQICASFQEILEAAKTPPKNKQ